MDDLTMTIKTPDGSRVGPFTRDELDQARGTAAKIPLKPDPDFEAAREKVLSYDFSWLLRQKRATARHAIHGGQWRGSDREKVGRSRRRAVVGSPPSSSSVLNGYPGAWPE